MKKDQDITVVDMGDLWHALVNEFDKDYSAAHEVYSEIVSTRLDKLEAVELKNNRMLVVKEYKHWNGVGYDLEVLRAGDLKNGIEYALELLSQDCDNLCDITLDASRRCVTIEGYDHDGFRRMHLYDTDLEDEGRARELLENSFDWDGGKSLKDCINQLIRNHARKLYIKARKALKA